MKKTSRASVLVTAGIVLVAGLACKKLTGGSSEESSSTTSAASGGESTGVAECDEFLDKYSKCVESNVPEVARGALKQSIDKMRETYKTTAASSEAAKSGLAQGCKQSLETTKQAMAQYNCTW